MNDFSARMNDRREREEPGAPGDEKKAGGRKSSLLSSSAPGPEAGPDQLAAWLTVVLALGADPVASATRYGRHDDARMVLTLDSGQRIVFDRAADAFDARVIVRRVMIATGVQVPPYSYPDAVQIAGAILRLAEIAAEDDDREEAAEWAHRFLSDAEGNTFDVGELATPAGRYEAITNLMRWRSPQDVLPLGIAGIGERSIIVRDGATGDKYIRVSDFAAHVRALGTRLQWGTLHSRMVEIGWEHLGEMEQRQPGGHGRARCHAYRVPAGWADR